MLDMAYRIPMALMAQDAAAPGTEEAPEAPAPPSELDNALASAKEGDATALVEIVTKIAIEWGPRVAIFLAVIIVAYFVGKFLARIASAPVRKRVDETLGRFVGKIVFYGIMVGAFLGAVGQLGVNVASFAAVVAAMGFAVGLAFQGTLSNFAAGVMLLVFRPFKVGDVINAAGIIGKVQEIDLFVTTFDTPDNRRIIVPNSAIAGGTIENITHHPVRRVDVEVGVAYDADIDKTREVLTAVAETHRDVLVTGEGREYQIFLANLGGSSVDWIIRFWADTPDYWAVKEKLTREAKYKLDEAGIGIPFPQMDVHLFKQEG